MRMLIVFISELAAKIVLSGAAWIAFFFVSWDLYIGDHAGERGPAWAAIMGQAYYYIMLLYLSIDYGILTRRLKPKYPRRYWGATIATLTLLTFTIGFAAHHYESFLFWQSYYFHNCLFKPANQSTDIFCNNFIKFFQ